MPEKKTIERAKEAKREGKSASTQAGEFVREEIHHVREGKHGARSTQQAIAIGLSKARRAGVNLRPPKKGAASEITRSSAKSDYQKGKETRSNPSGRRSQATTNARKREGRAAASTKALSMQARSVSHRRARESRSASARRAARARSRHR